MISPAITRYGVVAALTIGGVALTTTARATVIVQNPGIIDSVPGLAGFQTTGSLMGGMSVRAVFSNNFQETVSWTDGVGDFGGAFGSDWSLTVDGDTFFTDWNFTNDLGVELVLLELDGAPGRTIFDRSFNNMTGTLGSALGRDFAENPTVPGVAAYSRQVAIGMNMPVGDIWHMLSVRFAGQGMLGNFTFIQDTDNDIRRQPPPTDVPEPSTVALLGACLTALGMTRRRRR